MISFFIFVILKFFSLSFTQPTLRAGYAKPACKIVSGILGVDFIYTFTAPSCDLRVHKFCSGYK